jgi:hypothetical protein
MLKQLRRLSSVKLKVNFTIKILSAHFGANDGLNQGICHDYLAVVNTL